MAFSVSAADKESDTALVLDNSVMMRWLFSDGSVKDQRFAKRIFDTIKQESLHVFVPYLWVYESAFVVNFYTKNGDISLEDGTLHLANLFDLCTVIRGEELPVDLYHFSDTHGISAYDSSYLMLAQQYSCLMATLDKKMMRVAAKLSIPVFT